VAHAQLDAVRFLGVKTLNVERNGEQGLCYAGDAFAQALRLTAPVPTHARAALGLTRNDCIPSDLRASERRALDEARLATINKIEIENAALSELTKNQLRVREANIRASLAYSDAKLEKPNSPHAARAIALLTAVNKAELNDEAREDYHDAAVRVGVVRWGAIPQTATHERAGVRVSVSAGEPGQTCVNVRDAKGAEGKRCTYAQVWVNSLAIAPQGNVATLAVQSSATWRELWVMRKEGASWAIDVLPPSTNLQDVGLVEFAGFAGNQLLIARETSDKGRVKTSFEKISVTSLNTELKASTPTLIAAFARSQDPMWKAQTLTLR
jgi:hypothetical protein